MIKALLAQAWAHWFEILLLILIMPVVAFGLLLLAQGPQPPLAYTQTEYTPERKVYAPGETLVYTATLTIKRAGAITLTRGFRTQDSYGRVRLCDGTNAPIIQDTPPPFPAAALGQNVEGQVKVTIPNLPPGRYWLISSVAKPDGGESLTQVGFLITRPCHVGSG